MSVPKYITQVCQIGQGAACCRFLILGSKGWECAKMDPASKKMVNQAYEFPQKHGAQGDNCAGLDDFDKASEELA